MECYAALKLFIAKSTITVVYALQSTVLEVIKFSMNEQAITIDKLYEGAETKTVAVRRLMLQNFRSYSAVTIETKASPIVLSGANGAGKTNILEALSFLSPGRGLRSAKLGDVDKVGAGAWAISAALHVGDEEHHVGTGRAQEPSVRGKRIVQVNATRGVSQSELANLCTVMWQTPQMDGLFLAGASERRNFVDRMVYHFDSQHAKRVSQYEHAMRERMRLLQDNADKQWIAILEEKMAAEAVAIAAARNETIALVSAAIAAAPSAFPKAVLRIDGELEQRLLSEQSALAVEDEFRAQLYEKRYHDARSGRTQAGVHRSDLNVFHDEKRMPANLCSTGEQKALLLSIVLAEARAKALWKDMVPILLLDEVVAHLDITRREALFEEIIAMKAQCWMTGTDSVLFEGLEGKAQFFNVKDADVEAS